MSIQAAREREIREIAIAANSGEASDEQIARLDELVRSDRQLANYAARLLDQQASLAWQGLGVGRQVSDVRYPETLSDTRILTPVTSTKWAWPTIAVGIGFILGGLSAALVYRWNIQLTAQRVATADSPATAEPQYEARLVSSTACLWDGKSMGSRQIGSGLASGESLHLLE